ncbi:hypothetical protein D918_07520 [Trichuris suis]|nr:hypothetical protein D918_07520 [Trichuris suis]
MVRQKLLLKLEKVALSHASKEQGHAYAMFRCLKMLQSKNAIRLRNDGICQYSHHETAYLDNNETFCRHSWKHTSFVARSSSTKQFASQPVSLLLFLCIAVFASAKECNGKSEHLDFFY